MHEYSFVSIRTLKLKWLASHDSKDMIGAIFFKMGHVTLTTPVRGVVCHRKGSTCYILHANKIWRLLLWSFQR